MFVYDLSSVCDLDSAEKFALAGPALVALPQRCAHLERTKRTAAFRMSILGVAPGALR